MSLQLGAPTPLAANHILDDFACGEPSLDEWLKRRALANQLSGAARQTPAKGQSGAAKPSKVRSGGFYATVSCQGAIFLGRPRLRCNGGSGSAMGGGAGLKVRRLSAHSSMSFRHHSNLGREQIGFGSPSSTG